MAHQRAAHVSALKRYPKKIVAPTLSSIRRRASNDSLEVEHILEAAALKLDGLPELLDELATAEGWSDTNQLPDGTLVVPLARWARVASAYCHDGMQGLKAVLEAPGHESFVLALLEELHSAEAVDAIIDFFSRTLDSPADDPALVRKMASTLNQILCFKPEVEITAPTRDRIRVFVTDLLDHCSDQVERAAPVLLLRAVGDDSSLDLLEALPPFTDAWETTIPTTKRAIRKRLKSTKG